MIAILNPVDGQPISYRAIAPGDSLASGEISYSGVVPRADLLGSAVAAVVSGAVDGATITFPTTAGTSTLLFGSTGAGIATDATFRGLVVRTLSAYLGLRAKLATLLGQIAAATDVAAVQAVTW